MIRHYFKFDNLAVKFMASIADNFLESLLSVANQNFPPILRTPNHVVMADVNNIVVGFYRLFVFHARHYTVHSYIIQIVEAAQYIQLSLPPCLPMPKGRGFSEGFR